MCMDMCMDIHVHAHVYGDAYTLVVQTLWMGQATSLDQILPREWKNKPFVFINRLASTVADRLPTDDWLKQFWAYTRPSHRSMHAHIHACSHTRTHTRTHTDVRMRTRSHTWAYTWMHMWSHTWMHKWDVGLLLAQVHGLRSAGSLPCMAARATVLG